MHDFRLSARRADNLRAGNTLSHMQTWGYRWKYMSKYVIIINIMKTVNIYAIFQVNIFRDTSHIVSYLFAGYKVLQG